MESWINLVGYQITWLVAVSGAGQGKSWPAWIAASLLCGGHLIASARKGLDLRVLGICALFGAASDGFLTTSGLLQYAPARPAVPVAGCPLWILALWLAFSTTLTRSLGWLRGQQAMGMALGAVGGPLAYCAAARGWGVISFAQPEWRGLLVLSISWATALGILVHVVTRAGVTSGVGVQPAGRGA